ncbi:hypothetical protein [Bifidobacterium cuniculi]|uniref:hypothetical protein n=1 Tax=Bifidobacterium cuniculi TaxID=1688 RepID=UPI00138E442A|nr:hypothetical protein [Bifidobacterium cuniculi]
MGLLFFVKVGSWLVVFSFLKRALGGGVCDTPVEMLCLLGSGRVREGWVCVLGGCGVGFSLAAAGRSGSFGCRAFLVCGGGLRTQERVLYYFLQRLLEGLFFDCQSNPARACVVWVSESCEWGWEVLSGHRRVLSPFGGGVGGVSLIFLYE